MDEVESPMKQNCPEETKNCGLNFSPPNESGGKGKIPDGFTANLKSWIYFVRVLTIPGCLSTMHSN